MPRGYRGAVVCPRAKRAHHISFACQIETTVLSADPRSSARECTEKSRSCPIESAQNEIPLNKHNTAVDRPRRDTTERCTHVQPHPCESQVCKHSDEQTSWKCCKSDHQKHFTSVSTNLVARDRQRGLKQMNLKRKPK